MRTRDDIIIYEYPKCSTCKKALKYLDERGVRYRKVDISEQPPAKAELKTMLRYYGGNIRRLLNTSGLQYRALKLSDKIGQMEDNEVIELLSKNGKLVKRPFILTGDAGCIGFKQEEWDHLLR